MSSRVDEKIAGLESLDAAARRAHPEQAFGRPPPKGSNQRLLRYAAAYDATLHPAPTAPRPGLRVVGGRALGAARSEGQAHDHDGHGQRRH